jgi:hypothetical protein
MSKSYFGCSNISAAAAFLPQADSLVWLGVYSDAFTSNGEIIISHTIESILPVSLWSRRDKKYRTQHRSGDEKKVSY